MITKFINKLKENYFISIIIEFFSLVSKNNISQLSIQGAYYVFASLVPFLILLLTLLKFTPLDFNFATKMIVEGVPPYFQSFAYDMVNQVYNNSNFVMSFSILILLVTASKGIYIIIQGFNVINNVDSKSSFFKHFLFSLLYTLIFIFAIPIIVILTIFGQSIIELLINIVPFISDFQLTIVIMRLLGSTLLIFILLLIMYKFLPSIKMKFKDILLGTLIATICWQLFSYLFSIYVNFSLKNASLYGSMSIMLILLFWLYGIYYIIFIGAQINAMIYNKRLNRDIKVSK